MEDLLLLVISLVLGLGGLVLAGWLAATGQATTFDGLFLTLVALVLSLVFLLNFSWTLRSQELRRRLHSQTPDKESALKPQANPYPPEKKKTA